METVLLVAIVVLAGVVGLLVWMQFRADRARRDGIATAGTIA